MLHLRRTLALAPVGPVLAPVAPDVERALGVQTAAASVLPDLGREPAFVHAVAPLGEALVGAHGDAGRRARGEEQRVCAGGADAGGDEDVREARGVDETAGPEEGARGGEDLGLAAGGEWDLGGAGVAAVDGPLGLAVAGEEDAGGGHGRGGGDGGGGGGEGCGGESGGRAWQDKLN